MKVLLLAISLALNTHWVIAKQSATAYTDSTVVIHAALAKTSEGDPVASPVAALVTEERPPLPVGYLRLSESHLFGVSILCFERERWQLSQRAFTAFELTMDAEAQVNQALGELKNEIFRMEADCVEKHSDWHYTMGAFSKEEVMRLRYAAVGLEDNHTKDTPKVWVVDVAAKDFGEPFKPAISIDRHGRWHSHGSSWTALPFSR